MQVDDVRQAAIEALEEIKARDIVSLDVRPMTTLFDYMIVATADSVRQAKSLARNISDRVKERGGHVVGTEGQEGGDWVLVDLGCIIVHVMQPATRSYYSLEELWGGGTQRRVVAGRAGEVIDGGAPAGL